jgi:FkbM family methyltransferase
MSLRGQARRALWKVGLDVRRPRSAHDIAMRIEQLCREASGSEIEQQAAFRLFAGLARFTEQGVVPCGQLSQDAFALGSQPGSGFFVEVGAGHPTDLSNVARLIDPFGWCGIRIDPNPVFANLHRQASSPRVTFVEAAIASRDQSTMEMVLAGELSARSDLLNSDGHARTRKRAMRRDGSHPVSARRLDILLDELGAPAHVDYVSIDVEGAELEVLATFPFNTRTIGVLTIEHNFREEQSKELDAHLAAYGYARVLRHVSAWDAWYLSIPQTARAETP